VTKTVGNYQLAGTHDGTSFTSYVSTEGAALISTGWHQAAIAWDSTALTFYIDGVAKATVASPTALPSDMDVTTPTWIGRDESGTLYVEVDDFRIYDRALSQERITALYTATW
jgi:beta-glucanase (GH16 family)